jgi:hypothetical protein
MHLLCLVLLVVVSAANSTFTTQYYKNLISQRTAEAQIYELPNSNEEFRAGVDSDEINGTKCTAVRLSLITWKLSRFWKFRFRHSRSGIGRFGDGDETLGGRRLEGSPSGGRR